MTYKHRYLIFINYIICNNLYKLGKYAFNFDKIWNKNKIKYRYSEFTDIFLNYY